jgi:hypothetical membrane protein
MTHPPLQAKQTRRPARYHRYLLLAGLLGPVVHLLTTVLGGAIRPGYSHLAEAISELTAAGAPNKALLDPLYALYDLLALLFGIGVFLTIGRLVPGRAVGLGRLGGALLIVGGLFTLAFIFFPQDPGGPPVTFAGTVHLVLAGVVALASLLAILLLGLAARKAPRLRGYAVFSFVADGVVLLAGSLTPVALSGGLSPYFGLIERTTIGAILLWTFVTAWTLLAAEAIPQEDHA